MAVAAETVAWVKPPEPIRSLDHLGVQAPSRPSFADGPSAHAGVHACWISQLFDLLMLAADLQEQVLALEAVDGAEQMAERALRVVAHAGTWAEQRAAWDKLADRLVKA